MNRHRERLPLIWLLVAAYTSACSGTAGPTLARAATDAPATGVAAGVPQAPRGKRAGPVKVAPVIIGSLRIEALHWGKARGLGQNGGYIAAFDRDSGKELWVLKVYDVHYDSKLEPDAQDVFISSMSKALFGPKLNITDELGRSYLVDVSARSVRER